VEVFDLEALWSAVDQQQGGLQKPFELLDDVLSTAQTMGGFELRKLLRGKLERLIINVLGKTG
jgi:hypothetical protein